MALDFPSSPTPGEIYTGPGTTTEWLWDGAKWTAAPSTGGGGGGSGAPPSPAATPPPMDGTAAVGVSLLYARGDHVHPSDTSRMPLSGGTMSGNLQITTTTTSPAVVMNSPAGQQNLLEGERGGNLRWSVVLGDSTAESGSNAGSDFEIYRYADTGAVLDSPLHITRATGRVYITNEFTMLGPVDLDAAMTIGANMIPANNAYSCGYGGNAWQQVGSYSFFNASDARDKKHVHPAPEGALDEVNRVPVMRYRWQSEADDAPLHTGFLATDVADVLGSDRAAVVVGQDAAKSLALNLMDMIATLWQAVQELSARCAAV